MQICRQGNGHYLNGLNNQDFYYTEDRLKLIMDGCSACKFSEVGTRLFAQAFSMLETRLDYSEFESNVNQAFMKACQMVAADSSKVMAEFIANNMLFTILACFELEDKFVVKYIGDGYIVTVNSNDMVSYIRLFYGKTPPYYGYNKLDTGIYSTELKFKTFEFPKKDFKAVGIASDGIQPIAERKFGSEFDSCITQKETKYSPEGIIRSNQSAFFDDVTILI